MISLASLLIGAGAGFIVGGFTGCGAMAWRHSRLIEHVQQESKRDQEARDAALLKALNLLAAPVVDRAQYDAGTPREDKTFSAVKAYYGAVDALKQPR